MAGYLHAGESDEQAARRRVSEELKVKPKSRWLGRTAMGDDGVTKFVGVVVGEVAATDHMHNVGQQVGLGNMILQTTPGMRGLVANCSPSSTE